MSNSFDKYNNYKIPDIGTNVRNIKPRGRIGLNAENITHVSKDKLEKQRLKERNFGHIRYSADIIDDPINQQKKSLCYVNDIERFHHNFAQSENKERHQRKNKYNQKIENLKNDREKRENLRYDLMHEQYQRKQSQLDNFVPLKNNPSMPYNPITLRYNDSLDGKRLQLADEKTIWRAKLRQKMLFEKQSSGYDPINGNKQEYQKSIVRPNTPPELYSK